MCTRYAMTQNPWLVYPSVCSKSMGIESSNAVDKLECNPSPSEVIVAEGSVRVTVSKGLRESIYAARVFVGRMSESARIDNVARRCAIDSAGDERTENWGEKVYARTKRL